MPDLVRGRFLNGILDFRNPTYCLLHKMQSDHSGSSSAMSQGSSRPKLKKIAFGVLQICFSLLACLFVCLFVCLLVCSFVRLFVCSFVCLFVCLFVRLFACLFACLSVCLFVCSFVCVYRVISIYSIKKKPLIGVAPVSL